MLQLLLSGLGNFCYMAAVAAVYQLNKMYLEVLGVVLLCLPI